MTAWSHLPASTTEQPPGLTRLGPDGSPAMLLVPALPDAHCEHLHHVRVFTFPPRVRIHGTARDADNPYSSGQATRERLRGLGNRTNPSPHQQHPPDPQLPVTSPRALPTTPSSPSTTTTSPSFPPCGEERRQHFLLQHRGTTPAAFIPQQAEDLPSGGTLVVPRSSIIRSSIDFYKNRLDEVLSHQARVLYTGNDIIFHAME